MAGQEVFRMEQRLKAYLKYMEIWILQIPKGKEAALRDLLIQIEFFCTSVISIFS